ncbi:MAG: AMP-binding protein [Nitrospirae bacterium]|nr:AMP-binding protein [Nitrospirota bacterium]
MADRSLLHRFFRVAARSPDRSFLEWQDGDPRRRRSLSYRDAARMVVRLSKEIGRRLPPGPVLVACPPGPEFVVGELALMLAARLPVLVDHLLPPDSLREVAELFEVRSVYASPEIFAALSRPDLSHLLPALPETNDSDAGDQDPLLDRALPEGEETVAHLLLTSGTTGRPKGVPLTHRNLLSNAEAILSRGVYSDGDRVLCVLPLHHSYPYMVNLLLPLSVAGTAVFSPDLAPQTLREILAQDRISLFPAVPLLWEGFHRRIEEEIARRPAPVVRLIREGLIPLSLSLRRRWGINAGRWLFPAVSRTFGPTMKALASGGAALRPEVVRDFIAMGLVMLEGYGLTETSPVVSMTTPEDLAIGTVGPPLPGVEVRILPAEEGRPGGRVQVRGPSVAPCYWTGAGKTLALVDGEGWFDTGDLGRWEEGRLRLVGREKEVLVLPNGKNIFAEPIESGLSRGAGVAEAAVLLEGKALVALIRPEGDPAPPPEALSALVEGINRHLPSHSRIAAYEVVTEPLPRTRLGKLRRFLLPEIYRTARRSRLSRGRAESSEPADSPLFEKVRALLSRMAGEDVPVVDEARLEADLGFDSLARIELLAEIEEILGREIPDDLLSEIATVGDLRAKLSSLAPEGPDGKGPAEELLFRPLSPEEEGKIPPPGALPPPADLPGAPPLPGPSGGRPALFQDPLAPLAPGRGGLPARGSRSGRGGDPPSPGTLRDRGQPRELSRRTPSGAHAASGDSLPHPLLGICPHLRRASLRLQESLRNCLHRPRVRPVGAPDRPSPVEIGPGARRLPRGRAINRRPSGELSAGRGDDPRPDEASRALRRNLRSLRGPSPPPTSSPSREDPPSPRDLPLSVGLCRSFRGRDRPPPREAGPGDPARLTDRFLS